jgi:uncharacterized membrane protein required for colicin V production
MMNWLDIALLSLLGLTAAIGWRRGLVLQLFDVASVIVAYVVALRFGRDFVFVLDTYIPVFRWLPRLMDNPTPFGFTLGDVVVRLIGFLLLFFLVRLLFRVVGGMMHSIFSLPVLGTVNALGGMVFGLLKGLLLGLILVAVGQLLETSFWASSLQESSLATFIMEIWPVIYEQMVLFLINGTS